MTLVEFLRARHDEDEQVARDASPGPWRPNAERDQVLACDDIEVADGFALSGHQLRATVEHIARHDPARVLAEVEAKRRVIEIHAREHECVGSGGERTANDGSEWPCLTLRLHGLPHDQHPDYREEWRP